MNMNDKEWNDVWDNAPEDEDDDYNDVGSDIDANNDETFDNAAEWNEDEHEELIARDWILSNSGRGDNDSSHNRNNHSNHNNNSTNNNINSSNRASYRAANHSSNTNNGTNADLESHGSNIVGSMRSRSAWNSLAEKQMFPALGAEDVRHQAASSSETTWQSIVNPPNSTNNLRFNHQQVVRQPVNYAMLARAVENDRAQIMKEHDQPIPRGNFQEPKARQILTVDELENQLMKSRISQNDMPRVTGNMPRRAGWSPFGGKDLFTNPELPDSQCDLGIQNLPGHGQVPQSLTIEQQRQLLLQQQQHLLQQQNQLQHMALLKQQQIQQEQLHMAQSRHCITVEELERQMMLEKANKSPQSQPRANHNLDRGDEDEKTVGSCMLAIVQEPLERRNANRHDKFNRLDRESRENHDHRDRRDHRDQREHRDQRDHREHREFRSREHRDQRDNRNRRDHWRNRCRYTILPPQVQLSVLDKARNSLSINTHHSDEFLQDIKPTSKEGFLLKRHSTVSTEKVNHDGILTESERNWLTRIQEKIQADYDDNLDQDYYYLLYFNRLSATDEAAQKPCGPGVLDRRFIPRERLLYTSTGT